MKSLLTIIAIVAWQQIATAQGCTQGNCVNGVGTYVYEDGTKYVGEFVDSKADGHGVCYFSNGNVYVGDWKNHAVAGYGVWTYPDGKKVIGHYEGEQFIDHKTLAVGCLKGNCLDGFGEYLWEEGTLYVGQFKSNIPDGVGTCYFKDGSKYSGEWRNNKHNGTGTYYRTDGGIDKGMWKDHEFLGGDDNVNCVSGNCDNGFGIYKYSDGGVYIGEFKDQFRHGQGTYHWSNGDKYEGTWVMNNYEGQGTLTYSNGTVQSGIWKDRALISQSSSGGMKPEITWDQPTASTLSVTYSSFEVRVCIKSQSDVKSVELVVNGATIATVKKFKQDPMSGCSVMFVKSFPLRTGKNTIFIKAENAAGVTMSSAREVSLVTASQQKRLALVIGNANYTHANGLKNPVNDARSMARVLENQGFTVMKVENSTTREMKMAIDNFGHQLENYDVGLFYYSGHGVQVKGLNYLVPIDADIQSEAQVEYDCIQADRVLSFMEIAQTDVNIIILDACRNNPFKTAWDRSAATDGLAFMNAPTGTLIAYSTAPGKTASDGVGDNGLYTEALLQEINNPELSIMQVFQHVRNKVGERSSKSQIPWESTSLTGDFFFSNAH